MRILDLFETEDPPMPPGDDEIRQHVQRYNHYLSNLERHIYKRGFELQDQVSRNRDQFLHFHPWKSGHGIERTTSHHVGLEKRINEMTKIANHFISLNVNDLGEEAVNDLYDWCSTANGLLGRSLSEMCKDFPSAFMMHFIDDNTQIGKYDSRNKTYTEKSTVWDEVGKLGDRNMIYYVSRQNYNELSMPTLKDVNDFRELVKLAEKVEDLKIRIDSLA